MLLMPASGYVFTDLRRCIRAADEHLKEAPGG
jgi:hypothetical protein